MKPHRVRQVCRSHNPFSPSIALWQHFVLPYQPRRQRLSSAAAGAAESSPLENARDGLPTSSAAPTPLEQPESERTEQVAPRRFAIHKVLDRKPQTVYATAQSIKDVDQSLLQAKAAFDGVEDYTGVVVEALKSNSPTREKDLPWCVEKGDKPKVRASERLNLEIRKFYEYARPSRSENLARRHVVEQVRGHVRQVLPDNILEVFGSERTGIALATSDIDLRLMRHKDLEGNQAKLPPSREERIVLLEDLRQLLVQQFSQNNAYLLPMLRHARYPLITVQDRASGLDVQIVLANDTSVSRNLMQQYMGEYPYLRELYSVVKTTFDVRGLSDVFRGGFGSYSIFMMIVASLRHMPNKRRDGAGGLLHFLRFWSEFDTESKGISIEPALLFDKSEELVMTPRARQKILDGRQQPLPKYMLCLRDPADETNDLGRKGVCIKHVKETLRHLCHQLEKDMSVNTRYSLLAPLVGDTYSLNRWRREKLEQQGRRVLDQMQGSFAATAKAIREAEAEEAQKSKQEEKVLQSKPGASASDEFGQAITSSLGMPAIDEWVDGGDEQKGEAKIVYGGQDTTVAR